MKQLNTAGFDPTTGEELFSLGDDTLYGQPVIRRGVGMQFRWTEGKPTLHLFNPKDYTGQRYCRYVIGIGDACRFAAPNGGAASTIAAYAQEAAEVLGLPDKALAIGLCIIDATPDLIKMPPLPKRLRQLAPSHGYFQVRREGKLVLDSREAGGIYGHA